jgi:hypothetical protein
MKKLSNFSVLLIIVLLSACTVRGNEVRGSGTLASQEQALSGVTGVTLATPGELIIQLGEPESLKIEMEENLLPYLETQVQDGVLSIGFKSGVGVEPTKPIRYDLKVKSLKTLINASLGNIHAPNLQAQNFKVEVDSVGNVDLAGLLAERLEVDLTSLGNLTISGGQAPHQDLTISSEGDYQAGDLLSNSAVVTINSNGDATIWVTDTLDVTLTSSGNVNYYGEPQVTTAISSSGKTNSLGAR